MVRRREAHNDGRPTIQTRAGEGSEIAEVTILGSGSRPPLVYLHCWPADTEHMGALASGLEDRQVISLPPPPRVHGRYPTDFGQWATHYDRLIDSLELDGRLYLAGWSVAFHFCFEIARRRADGERPCRLLVSIDSEGPDVHANPRNLRRLAAKLDDATTWPEARSILVDDVGRNIIQTSESAVQLAIPARWRVAMAARHPASAFWWKASSRLAPLRIASFGQCHRYQAIPTPALIFATSRTISRHTDEMLGWRHLLVGPVEVVPVPGSHWTLLDHARGPNLVARLDAALRAADELGS